MFKKKKQFEELKTLDLMMNEWLKSLLLPPVCGMLKRVVVKPFLFTWVMGIPFTAHACI